MDNKETEYQLIERETLAELIKKNYKLAHIVLILEYLCSIKVPDLTLTAKEVREVLDLKPEEFEECCRNNWIRGRRIGPTQIFELYDVVSLAEKVHRRKRLRRLGQIPVINP